MPLLLYDQPNVVIHPRQAMAGSFGRPFVSRARRDWETGRFRMPLQAIVRRLTMRVMVLVKATDDSEKGFLPTTEAMEAMGRFNDELRDAGIMLTADGLKPSSQGKRIAFDGSTGLSPKPASWSPASGSGKSRTWTRRSPG
jgi:hypothetical protein